MSEVGEEIAYQEIEMPAVYVHAAAYLENHGSKLKCGDVIAKIAQCFQFRSLNNPNNKSFVAYTSWDKPF